MEVDGIPEFILLKVGVSFFVNPIKIAPGISRQDFSLKIFKKNVKMKKIYKKTFSQKVK